MDHRIIEDIVFGTVKRWDGRLTEGQLTKISQGDADKDTNMLFDRLRSEIEGKIIKYVNELERLDLKGKSSKQRMAVRKIWQAKRAAAVRQVNIMIRSYRVARSEDSDITNFFNNALR